MKNFFTFASLLFTFYSAFCQNISMDDVKNELMPLSEKISSIQSENAKLNSELDDLNLKLSLAYKIIDSLKSSTHQNSLAIAKTANELGTKIEESELKNDSKISEVNTILSTKTLYGIIGLLLAILISALLYWVLMKKQRTDKQELDGKLDVKTSNLMQDMITKIEKTKNDLHQENVKLDLKMMEILDNQLKVNNPSEKTQSDSALNEIDHSIPLKVADEITRISAYANTLDPNSQDAKALKSSVKRLINTFKASQYEIIDLLGQKYNDGMKITVINELEDSKLLKDEKIIVRIIKPLVKFKGEQIQAAQVDIAYGL